MSRRTQAPAATQHRWMVSYLDVLTILLIFFLTAAAKTWKNPPSLTSSSQTAARATPAPGVATRDGQTHNDLRPSAAADGDTGGSASALDRVEQKLKEEGLDVRPLTKAGGETDPAAEGGLAINLSQAVIFSPGDDHVRAEALPDLKKIAEALRGIPNKVNLAGHADAKPIHNRRFRNNWELAAARSLRLREALTRRYGIDESRVSISSYGALEPKSPNNTAGGRAHNRRVEILIYGAAP
jgi:chemotaxis protein MotB